MTALCRHGRHSIGAAPVWHREKVTGHHISYNAQAAPLQVGTELQTVGCSVGVGGALDAHARTAQTLHGVFATLARLTNTALCHRYQGHVSAALVLGGVDLNGPHLFTVCTKGCAIGCSCTHTIEHNASVTRAQALRTVLVVCQRGVPSCAIITRCSPTCCPCAGVPTWVHRLPPIRHHGLRVTQCNGNV